MARITLIIDVGRPYDSKMSDYDYAIKKAKAIKKYLWPFFKNKAGDDEATASIDVSVEAKADNYAIMNNKV